MHEVEALRALKGASNSPNGSASVSPGESEPEVQGAREGVEVVSDPGGEVVENEASELVGVEVKAGASLVADVESGKSRGTAQARRGHGGQVSRGGDPV